MAAENIQLKLVTYNVQGGQDSFRVSLFLIILAAMGVDVFCLQEVYKMPDGKFFGDVLLRLLGKNWGLLSYPKNGGEPYDFGNCILWNKRKLRLTSSRSLELPSAEQPALIERVLGVVSKRALHKSKRGALVATFKVGPTTVRVSNIHLDWQGGDGHRMKQLTFLREKLEKKKSYREIVCGDFNTVSIPYFPLPKHEEIAKILGEGFSSARPGRYFTAGLNKVFASDWVKGLQNLCVSLGILMPQQLDYIFVKGLKIKFFKVLKVKGSDHYPLSIDTII